MAYVVFFGVIAVFLFIVVRTFLRDAEVSPPETRTDEKSHQPVYRPFDASHRKAVITRRTITGSAYIVDGDTLVIQKCQIRLFGVDAPEMNHPYGKRAKWALVTLCKGQNIRAEVVAEDDHGRLVAQCYLQDGRDISAEMVKLGMAIDWKKYSGGIYRALEVPDARRKLWLADARQKGKMHLWEQFEANRQSGSRDE